MKIYFHLNVSGFSNCYIVVNESIKEAVIIDPGKIDEKIIDIIEKDSYRLAAVFVTHNHPSHVNGLKVLRKIYTPEIYAADWKVAGDTTRVIAGDGVVKAAGLLINYMAFPGHSADSMIYKIGNVLFTGDTISAGTVGTASSSYADSMLRTNIRQKIFSECDSTVIMAGHGPPTCVGAERRFNIDMGEEKARFEH